ncbi:MAG: hypothetical protein AAF170_15510 [Bacteroidota bacterium]
MRSLSILLSTVFLLSLWPTRAEAQLGRLVNRAQRAAERTVNRAADRTAEQATQSAVNNAIPGRSEAVEAARQLVRVRAGADGIFDPPGHGFDFSYITTWPDEGPTLLAEVEAIEARYPEWQEPMRVLGERFGPEWHHVQSGLLDLGVQAHEYGDGTNASSAFRFFAEGMQKVDQFRTDAAERSLAEADMMFRLLNERFQIGEIREDEAIQVKHQLELGHQFDPGNTAVNARLATVDAEIDAVRQGVQDEIGEAEWPHGTTNAPWQLEDDALAYFRAHAEWGGKDDVEVLAVVVLDDWQIAERNVLGQVTQWRLPVVVAASKPVWTELGAARAFELSVLANPGLPAPKEPPFWGYWVGDSFLINLDKVPNQ